MSLMGAAKFFWERAEFAAFVEFFRANGFRQWDDHPMSNWMRQWLVRGFDGADYVTLEFCAVLTKDGGIKEIGIVKVMVRKRDAVVTIGTCRSVDQVDAIVRAMTLINEDNKS